MIHNPRVFRQNIIRPLLARFVVVLSVLGSALPASADLIGHWNFEEGGGTMAFDSSGSINTHDGTISGASYVPGRVGNFALSFDGVNDYVQVLNHPDLSPNSIAISLWFRPAGSQVTSADILDKGHGVGSVPYHGGYVFQYDSNTDSIGALYGNGSTFVGFNTGPGYRDNQWHHIVANLGAAEVALYIDGAPVGSSGGAGPIVNNDADLYFGRHRALGRYFQGLIDDVRIYDAPLDPSQVAALFNPVPVPAALPLFLSALAMPFLALMRRRTDAGRTPRP